MTGRTEAEVTGVQELQELQNFWSFWDGTSSAPAVTIFGGR
jgi:hypothetical protein